MIVPYRVGVTGTKFGAKLSQLRLFRTFTGDWPEGTIVHHGDCVGFDDQAHTIVMEEGFNTEIHPPDNPKNRAFCKGAIKVHDPLPYLVRDDFIVEAAMKLYAAPSGLKERLRSGTWATIRRARKKGIPIVIMWYNGDVTLENIEGTS